MMQRYVDFSTTLVEHLLPAYRPAMERQRTSFRPLEVKNRRPSSYREDDTRLHVDSFSSSPVNGKRILRVFTNINPQGQRRYWRIGEDFASVLQRFKKRIPQHHPLWCGVLKRLRLTRGYRSHYDHVMLNLHNQMKADLAYQREVKQTEIAFPPQSTWLVFTDQVSHAVDAGQYVLEQTFGLPAGAMVQPQMSPLEQINAAFGKGR
jgi:hypothetical protein